MTWLRVFLWGISFQQKFNDQRGIFAQMKTAAHWASYPHAFFEQAICTALERSRGRVG